MSTATGVPIAFTQPLSALSADRQATGRRLLRSDAGWIWFCVTMRNYADFA